MFSQEEVEKEPSMPYTRPIRRFYLTPPAVPTFVISALLAVLALLAVYGHVFNVDTLKEGALARVAYDDIDKGIVREAPQGTILFDGPAIPTDSLVSRRTDLSESPWLFLLLLAILVCEQALAVHLSFHLKGDQSEVLSKVTRPAAAA